PSAGVLAASLARERQTPLAKMLFEKCAFESRQVANRKHSQCMKFLLRDLAHAGNIPYIEWRQKPRFFSRNHIQHSMRLGFAGADLRDQARCSNADRAVELCIRLHLLMKLVRRH